MYKKNKNALILLFKQEKKLILTGFIIGLVMFLLYFAFFYTTLYDTDCKIYVKNIAKSTLVAPLDEGGTLVSESGSSNPLFNLYELLKAEKLAYNIYPILKDKYPKDLALLGAYTKEQFFSVYLNLISASTVPSTDVISIKLRWPSQKNAPDVLNIVLEEFRNVNLFIKKSGETRKSDFIDQQTIEISEKLEKIRDDIKNYKLSTGMISLDQEIANTVNARMELENQINAIVSQIEYHKRKLEEFAMQLNINDPTTALKAAGVGTDPYLVNLSQQLANAKINYAQLKAKFTDKYIDVIVLKNQIEELKNLINYRKKETSDDIDIQKAIYDGPSSQVVSSFVMTQAEMVSLESQKKTLEKGIIELKGKEKELPVIQLGLDELIKLETALAIAFQRIKEKQLEAKIKESEIIDNIIVIKNPSQASSSKIYIITRFLGFILLGALLGLGAGYLKQAYEDKWIDIEEMKIATGQSILGTIPWVKDFESPSTGKIMDTAYTNMVSNIVSKAYLNQTFIISFISTPKSPSKSTITESIAKKLAEMSRSVLYIDLVSKQNGEYDLIKLIKFINQELRFNLLEKQHLYPTEKELKQDDPLSNSDLTAGILGIFKKTVKIQKDENGDEISNFHKIDTDIHIHEDNLNDYISCKGFKLILDVLKNHYEFILINAPHGFVVLPEIQTLKKCSEGIVLISSMATNRQELLEFIDKFGDSDAKILGIIAREENSEIEKNVLKLEEQSNREEDEEDLDLDEWT